MFITFIIVDLVQSLCKFMFMVNLLWVYAYGKQAMSKTEFINETYLHCTNCHKKT